MVGHRNENGEEEKEQVTVVVTLDDIQVICGQSVGQVSHQRHDDSEVVAIGFDKVVTRYGSRVNVMFAKVA